MTPFELPESSGIYRIRNTVNNKCYIGSAKNLCDRWRVHRSYLSLGRHHSIALQRAWEKYGPDAFRFEVIEFVLTPFLLERENYWLEKVCPFGNKGYNINRTAGSRYGMTPSDETREKLRLANLGKKHSEESLQKMSQSQTGRTHTPQTRERLSALGMGHSVSQEARENMRKAQLGKKQSEATKEKRRQSLIGRAVSEETRAQISQSNIEGNAWRMKTLIVTSPLGETFTVTGVGQFCKQHGLNHSALIQVAKGRVSQHKGWKARYP